jgi:hypothetical protein
MSEMVPFNGGLARREERAVGRELARIDAQADLQAGRIGAIAYVGKRAMHEVTMLSQLEVQLSALVPSATPRLQGIGDLTALAMAEVVGETVRRVK